MAKTVSLADQLRKAIRDSDMTPYRICKLTQIDQASLSRFLNEEGSVSLWAAERLMDLLGFTITPPRKRRSTSSSTRRKA